MCIYMCVVYRYVYMCMHVFISAYTFLYFFILTKLYIYICNVKVLRLQVELIEMKLILLDKAKAMLVVRGT